jgi:UDP:flavonoid glycosyltransferase YjiC (YdhE family)
MRLLFCSAQLPGHLDWGGYLPTAVELAHRGHEVLWASGAPVGKRIAAAGLSFQVLEETGWRWPPPPPLPAPAVPDEAWQQRRALRALDQWLEVDRVAAAFTELSLVAEAFQPDIVVSEPFVAASGLVAEQYGKPLVIAGWPAFARKATTQSDLAAQARVRLAELTLGFGLQGRYWTHEGPPALLSPHLHITYWSPTWYGQQALEPQTRHFGGAYGQRAAADRGLPPPDQLPWVLITLGTSFNNDPNFFLAAAHAAHRLGCLPIVTLGRSATPDDQAWLRRLPPGAPVRSLIAFDAIMPYLAAAIHHGGAGTTHALVTHAVPQIVVPHAADQTYQGAGVVYSGAGYYMPPKEVTVDSLAAALTTLLPDLCEFRTRAREVQAEFAALGGPPAAAGAIENLAKHI